MKLKITKLQATLGILAIAAVGGLAAASAASLSVEATSTLQAGTADMTGCQTSVLSVAAGTPVWNTDHYEVSSVALTNFDPDCDGNSVKVDVLDAAGNSLGSGATATVASNAATVTLSSAIDAKDVSGFAVVIY